jgi:hypothetical protein
MVVDVEEVKEPLIENSGKKTKKTKKKKDD